MPRWSGSSAANQSVSDRHRRAAGPSLRSQREASDFVVQLANVAAIYQVFPKYDDIDAARKSVQANYASGDGL